MFFIYRSLTLIFYPVLTLIIFMRTLTKKEHPKRYKEKIFSSSFRVERKENTKLIWFHAASVGEFKSILPLIKELNSKYSSLEFLITSVTLSSGKLANEELKKFENVHHRFFPIDVSFLIQKFILFWRPDIIFLVDSEIWPNLIFQAKKDKIPLGIINARITKKTFKRWMMIPSTARRIFSHFDLCLTSNYETQKYLDVLKAKNIIHIGNLKMINNIDRKNLENRNSDFLRENNFWLAASTHEGEEDFCIDTHLKIKEKIKSIITIIAPRHINRAISIYDICKKNGLSAQILNEDEKISEKKEIIIINTYGNLASFYKHSKSVFFGKSLLKKLEKTGGQSPIEAAQLGCKIYHGPYIYNFEEIYNFFRENEVAKKIDNSNELAENIMIDLNSHSHENSQFIDTINKLSKEILIKTTNNIFEFIDNETK